MGMKDGELRGDGLEKTETGGPLVLASPVVTKECEFGHGGVRFREPTHSSCLAFMHGGLFEINNYD